MKWTAKLYAEKGWGEKRCGKKCKKRLKNESVVSRDYIDSYRQVSR